MKKALVALSMALTAATLPLSAAADNPQVELQTSEGTIVVELAEDKAPKSVANFVQYVKDGHYNGTVFYRVIPNFMIQAGGFTEKMEQKLLRLPIENEGRNGLKNLRGTIAMARTVNPHSATAQFFINHKDNPGLDYPGLDSWGYAVFGQVVQGMEVVDRIAAVPTRTVGAFQNVPVTPVVIQSAKVLTDK